MKEYKIVFKSGVTQVVSATDDFIEKISNMINGKPLLGINFCTIDGLFLVVNNVDCIITMSDPHF